MCIYEKRLIKNKVHTRLFYLRKTVANVVEAKIVASLQTDDQVYFRDSRALSRINRQCREIIQEVNLSLETVDLKDIQISDPDENTP